jgi:hypothetical protein
VSLWEGGCLLLGMVEVNRMMNLLLWTPSLLLLLLGLCGLRFKEEGFFCVGKFVVVGFELLKWKWNFWGLWNLFGLRGREFRDNFFYVFW